MLFDMACSVQLGEGYTECHSATGIACRPGLTRAHMEAWKRLADSGEPAAWVFE